MISASLAAAALQAERPVVLAIQLPAEASNPAPSYNQSKSPAGIMPRALGAVHYG